MSEHTRPLRRSAHRWPARAFAALLAVSGCSDDPVEPQFHEREVGVVLTSTDVALTIFDVDDPTVTRVVGLGPDGSPVTLAVRGSLAAVPLGVVPAVAVVDVSRATLVRTITLPEGSGATGVGFVNDSIALVANPELGSVSPVNVLRGTVAEPIPVGRFPQGIVVSDGRAYVLNAELENFVPAGPSTVTVLSSATLQVVSTIVLSGENVAAGAIHSDGRLFLIQSGTWGADNGSVSVVDTGSLTEIDFVEGFVNFPGSIAVQGDGRVFVGAFGVGVLIWDSRTSEFVRGADDPITPDGVASTSGLGFDNAGRLYTLTPDCTAPALVNRLAADFSVEVQVPVGVCPFAIAFTKVEDVS